MTSDRASRALIFLFRGLSLALIPISSQVPMALTLYWTTSAFFSVAQNCYFWILARRHKKAKDAFLAITAPMNANSMMGVKGGNDLGAERTTTATPAAISNSNLTTPSKTRTPPIADPKLGNKAAMSTHGTSTTTKTSREQQARKHASRIS